MLKNMIENYLGEPVRGYKKEGGAWFTLIRVNNPESSRFGLFISPEKEEVKIYDRKEDKTKTFKIDNKDVFKSFNVTKEEKNYESIYQYVKKLLVSGKKDTHSYIKGLEDFIPNDYTWRVVKKSILVPYTNFDLYPAPLGAKWYPEKKCLKGSIMKGSFHSHKFSESNETWVLGEGFKECLVASRLIESANVLEVGGCGNMQAVINKIPKANLIYVMGENDTKEFYNNLQKKNKHIKVTFPNKGKDFADEYLANKNLKEVKLQITGASITQKGMMYKPLGIEDLHMCIYSKITCSVHKIKPDKLNDTLRVCYKPSGWEALKKYDREVFANKVFSECVRVGDYMSEHEYGVGLWEYKKRHFFNTGNVVYEVIEGGVKPVPYEEVLNNDFLLIKQSTHQQYLPDPEFDKTALESVIMDCDWSLAEHGKMLLGFLMQSIYAGSIDFRPTLWIMSDASTAGKSWLTSWIKENLLINHRAQEGGKTTPAGLRQDTANFSCPVFIDEFGEKGTEHTKNAREILEMLRTACTGKAPIKLGTAEQRVIRQRVRFSAILSCIDGVELLEEQDYERTIFLKILTKDKERFFKEVEPVFRSLEGRCRGFITYALNNFHLYKKWLPLFLSETVKHFKGHRFKGVASVICGYAVYKNDFKAGLSLFNDLRDKDQDLFSSFYIGHSQDVLDKVMNKLYSSRITDGNFSDGSYVRVMDTLDNLASFGMKTNKEKTFLFIEPKLAAQFLNLIKFETGITAEGLRRVLKNSKFFRGPSSYSFNDKNKKRYCLKFALKGVVE